MSETFPRWGLNPVDFIEVNPEKIKAEIITAYEAAANRTLADGDPVRLFLLTIADRFIVLQNNINIAARLNLLSYATGEHLDALGSNLSVERLQASHAVTTLSFALAQAMGNDFVIPAGYEVTNGLVTFATDAELVIRAGTTSGEISATCTTAGLAGNNYLAGQIQTIVSPLPFLASATNTTTTAGGADIESDEAFAERIRLAPNSYSVAGSSKAYEFHAYSVNPAIIDVSVVSPNAGEVKVYPLMAGGALPTSDLLDQMEAYLSSDTIRPLTDFVEALSPEVFPYEINVEYWISKEDIKKSESIQKAVEEAVENFRLWQQTKIGRDISPDKLICNVLDAGAARVDFATLSPIAWQQLNGNQVAQCSKVSIVYKGSKDE